MGSTMVVGSSSSTHWGCAASAGNGDRLLAAHGKIGRIGVLAFQYIHTHICHRRVRKC